MVASDVLRPLASRRLEDNVEIDQHHEDHGLSRHEHNDGSHDHSYTPQIIGLDRVMSWPEEYV